MSSCSTFLTGAFPLGHNSHNTSLTPDTLSLVQGPARCVPCADLIVLKAAHPMCALHLMPTKAARLEGGAALLVSQQVHVVPHWCTTAQGNVLHDSLHTSDDSCFARKCKEHVDLHSGSGSLQDEAPLRNQSQLHRCCHAR